MTNKLEEKRQLWHQHIQNWKNSGQSQKAYCENHQLKPHQFWYWQRQFNNAKHGDDHASQACSEVRGGFVPVQTEMASPHAEGIYLELPNGIRLHGLSHASSELLKNIIQAAS